MKITWDENKNALNKKNHRVSFELAQFVFDDPLHLSRQDRVVNGEERWQAVGTVDGTTLLLVAHTWSDDENEEHIRIISARLATKNEREIYETNSGISAGRTRRARKDVRRGH